MRTAVCLLLLLMPLAAQDRIDFQKQIAPILIERCIDCHGPKEQKGDLRLDAREHLFLEDEEDFWTVIPKEPGESELIRRLGLPLDDEEVMPNKGEPLTKEQQALFTKWVEQGAEWPEEGDKFIADELAAQVIPLITFDLPKIDEAMQTGIDKAVVDLKKIGAVVQRVAADTPALEVNLSLLRDKVTDKELAMLAPLAPVLVWLNVSRTAITENGSKSLAALTELRRLNVAGTKLGTPTFQNLSSLDSLEHVNAYGTQIGDEGLLALAALPSLKRVYAWQTKVTKKGAAMARQTAPKLQVDLGDYVEERLAAAQKEIEEREARNKPINETCPVIDKPAKAEHFVVHEGRRIAFCCPKCKKAFEKDPAKYLAKLPPKKK